MGPRRVYGADAWDQGYHQVMVRSDGVNRYWRWYGTPSGFLRFLVGLVVVALLGAISPAAAALALIGMIIANHYWVKHRRRAFLGRGRV